LSSNKRVFINQLGYRPGDRKTFTAAGIAGSFEVVDARAGSVVYAGETSAVAYDASSGIEAAKGEFTAVRQSGTYFIRMVGNGDVRSPLFPIEPEPYREAGRALLKNFYYNRCGIALEPEYAGPWAHAACHLSDAHVHGEPSERHTQIGGWHDAGDYGKYTVPAAKAVADLLLAYEWFPGAFTEPVGIPESGNGIPDVLNEVKFEMDFLLRMQRADGAVYHKVTTAVFPPLDTMPEDDDGDLIFSPVSDASTASFAAVAAMAARFFKRIDPDYAGACALAAKAAWSWLQSDAMEQGFVNPADIKTGEYGDDNWQDEIYWAAAELYKLTGEEAYLLAAAELARKQAFSLTELGWADVGGYGTLALLTLEGEAAKAVPSDLRELLLDAWIAEARLYAERAEADGFGISLLPDDYIWGSNMVVLNRAMLLITASRLAGDRSFAAAALDHWNYLFGRNVLGCSYVTGHGSNPVRNPHHRPSVADGVEEPVPGMVAGGPNAGLQDEIAAAELKGRPPAACFIDHIDSYSTFEIAIYWNSPAVFVAAFVNAVPEIA